LERSIVAEGNEESTNIHLNREELGADEAWINKLARFFEHDPQVFGEVRAHIKVCETCLNVVQVWEGRYNRSDFLAWAYRTNGSNGAPKPAVRLHLT
jgi:hypothetical protein